MTPDPVRFAAAAAVLGAVLIPAALERATGQTPSRGGVSRCGFLPAGASPS